MTKIHRLQNVSRLYVVFLLLSAWLQLLAAQELVVPLRPDPPPSIDGELLEWQMSPLRLPLDKVENIVFGKDKWQEAKDLSAVLYLGWDQNFLYLAGEISDEALVVESRGKDLWKGDHFEVFIDTDYAPKNDYTPFGNGQFQIGLSPGNFQKSGNMLADIPADFYVWHPAEVSGSPIRVSSKKTPKGYLLEAAIPWDLLKYKPQQGKKLGIDICVSDSDVPGGGQQSLLSLVTKPWKLRDRSRLLPLVFGDTQGKAAAAPAMAAAVKLGEELILENGTETKLAFSSDIPPAGSELFLSIKARGAHAKFAGGTQLLKIFLNSKELADDRLANRGKQFSFASGKILNAYSPAKGYFLYYAPAFQEVPGDSPYFSPDTKPLEFVFRISDLLLKGENTLAFKHTGGVTNGVVISSPEIRSGEGEKKDEKGKIDAGPLAVIVPEKVQRAPYAFALQQGGGFTIRCGDEVYAIESLFSEPSPAWNRLSPADQAEGFSVKTEAGKEKPAVFAEGKFYTLRREIVQLDEAVEIRDTLTSKSPENIGIIIRHQTRTAGLKKLHLGGLSPYSLSGMNASPENPTTLLITEKGSLGFMPEDDVFRVQGQNFCQDGLAGLADDQFVLKPKSSYTMVWSLYPSLKKDYYDFVNAVRRKLDANFTINGSFTFIAPREATLTNYHFPKVNTPAEKIAEFLSLKSARYASANIGYEKYKGIAPHGTAFPLTANQEKYRALFEKIRTLPGCRTSVYFHCFISVREGDATDYKDARLLLPNGSQADYGKPIYPIFIPTLENSFGQAVAKNVELILGPLGADGVYWDEMEYSAHLYHYAEPWDGFTGIIDPEKLTIKGYKSSVILLSQPWRVKMIERILKAGKDLIGNTNPLTGTMAKFKFPRFVETGSITHCYRSHLYTPIALGDHLTEKTEEDAYRQMRLGLDYGTVYYWYYDGIWPTHKTLTAYMFPFTPLELHKGHIIGKERILANHSGLYGWGVKCGHEVHVFNDKGVETEWKTVTSEKDGGTLTEVRIPEGYTVAIVRK